MRVGTTSDNWCCYKKGEDTEKDIWREKKDGYVKIEAEVGVRSHKLGTPRQSPAVIRGWKRGLEHILPQGLQGTTLLTTALQTSSLRIQEGIHLCVFKLPSLWSFLLAALGDYRG